MIWIGVRPADFTRYSENWVDHSLEQSALKAEMIIDSRDSATEPEWITNLYDKDAFDYRNIYKTKNQ
jgi:NADH-quinone oxidoreductase subunit M